MPIPNFSSNSPIVWTSMTNALSTDEKKNEFNVIYIAFPLHHFQSALFI